MTMKVKKRDEEQREAIVKQLLHETSMVFSGELDLETVTYEELIRASGPQDLNATWDEEALISAEDFEALRKEEGEEEFIEEKPPKIKSWVYIMEEDTITELTQIVGEPLDNVLPPKLFYYGEKILTHKNKDITVMVYVEIAENEILPEGWPYKNELFSKYFGDTDELHGKVYIHSQQHLPMMESASAVIDKEMEKMEVQDQVKEKKKKARVPRKKVQEVIEKIKDSEPDSKEEQEAVKEFQELEKKKAVKRTRAAKKQLSSEVLSKEVEEVKEPSPKRVKKTEEQKEAEKKAKEEAKAQKEAERLAKKQEKEAEKAKKAEEREAKKKEREEKKAAKKSE